MGLMSDFRERVEAEEARTHVRNVTRQSGSSFLWAIRSLNGERREAMYAIYAFCREVDDIADGMDGTAVKIDRLAEWQQELNKVFDGDSRTSTGRALQYAVSGYDLDPRDFELIIEGMKTDSQPAVRLQTTAELDTYIDRVACSVGRLSNKVFGIPEPASSALARALGNALQLTNILRDLDEDMARNRVYVPGELIEKHGAQSPDANLLQNHNGLAKACEELAERAEMQYLAAQSILAGLGGRASRPGTMMMHAYWLVFRKLQTRGWTLPRVAVRPTLLERLWILVRFGFR